ncbi:hypothetical protein Tco_1010867 [Tanacetum coccineum]
MAKKDMHTYVSCLKETELETLIATYDIPLDLRPRLPDPNFRMINLPARDTAICIYSRIFDSLGVRIPFSSFLLAVLKYFKVHISQLVPLGQSKVISFEVLCQSLNIEPTVTLFRVFHMLCRHRASCITDKVPTGFNQAHVDRLKAHVMKLCDIPEGVLVRSGLSRVWCNSMCDPVLRCSDNTVTSIHDFLCMPSLDKATVREEPHELGTSILVTKADHAAKQKASTRPKIFTNVTKRTRSGKKGSGAGSSEQAARDEVQQTDDGTLDDDDQRDGPEFAMKGNKSLYDVSPCEPINVIPLRTFDPSIGLDVIYPPILLSDKEVEPHQELPGGVRRTTRASFRAPYGTSEVMAMLIPILMPELVILLEMCLRGIFSLLSRDLITFLILLMRALGATFLLTPETIRKKFMESILVYDRKNFTRILRTLRVLRSGVHNRHRSLRSKVLTLSNKRSLPFDKKHSKYRNEKDALALKKEKVEEELVGTKSQLEHHKRQAEEIQGSIASFFQSDFTPLVRRFLKSSEFNRVFAGVLNTAISVGVERGLRMDRTDEEFRGLSQKVVGFIPDAKEKFDRVIAAFPDTTFPFLDKVSQHSQNSLPHKLFARHCSIFEPDRVTPLPILPRYSILLLGSLLTNTHCGKTLTSSSWGLWSIQVTRRAH